jgi:hypothetical protein
MCPRFKSMEASDEREHFMQVADQKEKLNRFCPPIIPISHPWFVIRDGDYSERQIFFSLSMNRYYKKSIPEMHNKEIMSTNTSGWLVLKDVESLDLCLLNLRSKEVVQLPRLETIDDCRICILSSPPSEPNNPCHIVFIDIERCIFYFCKLGDDKFGNQEFDVDIFMMDATLFEGKIYILTMCVLFTAEFIGSELVFTRIGLIESLPRGIIHFSTNLIESCGELFHVYMLSLPVQEQFEKVFGFLIFRMDPIEKVWVQVKNIGERTIFIAGNKSMSCIATEKGVKRNSIYFTKRCDRFLYVFDLEDCSISKFLPCPIVSYHGIELDWIMI